MPKKFLALIPVILGLCLFMCGNTHGGRSTAPSTAKSDGTVQAGTANSAAPVSGPIAPGQDKTRSTRRFTEDELNTIQVVKSTKNSVVFVTNLQYVQDLFFQSDEPVARGSGSGFVWDNEGRIVTNFHVIEDGVKFIVTLPNQKQIEAKLIGKEPVKDIAVLQLLEKVPDLEPVKIGSSADLEVGQKVIAIGNPFGFDHTVTQGIVSALGRNMPGAGNVTIRDMVQTDASINPGNSGGPLLDSSGLLIGMNTMIISPSGTSSGVGFAVPVNTIKAIVPQIIQFGKVTHPGIGGVTFVPDEYARRAGIVGAIINTVPRTSQAYELGLRGLTRDAFGRVFAQDIIVGVDGSKVKSYDDLFTALDGYKIGQTVTFTIDRNGKSRTVHIRLAGID